jgi:hypothetical protein
MGYLLVDFIPANAAAFSWVAVIFTADFWREDGAELPFLSSVKDLGAVELDLCGSGDGW